MFKDQGKVLNTDMLRRVYPLELLAELYSLWSKAKGFHIGDGKFNSDILVLIFLQCPF